MSPAPARLGPLLFALPPVLGPSRIFRSDLVAAAVLAVLLESGCFSAWAIQHPPSPPIDAREPLECTRGVAAPAADTGTALLFGAGAVALLVGGQSNSESVTRSVVTGTGAILLVPAFFSAFSAVAGYTSTARCRELEEAVDQCLKGDRVACGKLAGSGEGSP
jgi:hypothetical protein